MIKVNDYEISQMEYNLACQNYAMQANKQQLNENEKLALANQLVDARLLLLESYKADIEVSEYEVANNYDQLKANFPSNEEFESALQRMGDTEESMKEKLKDDLLLRKYINQEFYSRAEVSEEDQQKFYKEHEASFVSPPQIQASHILVEDEGKALSIKKEIDEGKSFEDMAKEHSSCPSSQKGGDLGLFGKGQMVQEFETAAFSLDPGTVSEPVKTNFGFHLIKVTDKKDEVKQSFEEAQKTIQSHMQGVIVNELMGVALTELRANASIVIEKDKL